MPLSDTQQRALEALDWLFDSRGARGTGRSLIWAIGLVREAARNPGQRMEISDHAEVWTHHHHRHLHEAARDNIQMLVVRDPDLSPYFNMDRHHFSLDLPRPIRDWMPVMDPSLPERVLRMDTGESEPEPFRIGELFWEEPSGVMGRGGVLGVVPNGTSNPEFVHRTPSPPSFGLPVVAAKPRLTVWERLLADD